MYQGKPLTIPEFKEAIQREIAAIPVTMLTNEMRSFTDRLQECIIIEGRHLPGTIFHNQLLPILLIKLLVFSAKLFLFHSNIFKINRIVFSSNMVILSRPS